MSTNTDTTPTTIDRTPRRVHAGCYTVDTPRGRVTVVGNVRQNGTRPSWGYTAPGEPFVIEYGFGTLDEAAEHAFEANR